MGRLVSVQAVLNSCAQVKGSLPSGVWSIGYCSHLSSHLLFLLLYAVPFDIIGAFSPCLQLLYLIIMKYQAVGGGLI